MYLYYPIALQIVAISPYFLMLLYGGIEISLSKAVQCGAGDDHSIRPTPKYILDNGLGNPFTKESQVMGTMPKWGAIHGFKENLKEVMDATALRMPKWELDVINTIDNPQHQKQFKEYGYGISKIISLIKNSYTEAMLNLDASTDPLDVFQPWKTLEKNLSKMEQLSPQQVNPTPEINSGVDCIETVISNLLGDPTTETINEECSNHLTRILNEKVDLENYFNAPGFDIENCCVRPNSIDYYIGEPIIWQQWIKPADPVTEWIMDAADASYDADADGPFFPATGPVPGPTYVAADGQILVVAGSASSVPAAAGQVADPIPTVDDQQVGELEGQPEGRKMKKQKLD